jgi:hypothetical protein
LPRIVGTYSLARNPRLLKRENLLVNDIVLCKLLQAASNFVKFRNSNVTRNRESHMGMLS